MRGLAAGPLLVGLLCWAGCAGRLPPPCLYPDELAYAGSVDSLGLAAFRALPPAEWAPRRGAAAAWRERAARSGRVAQQWQAFATAAGLAPDEAPTWLALADLQRLLGDRMQAQASLDQSEAAVGLAPQERRNALRLRLALARAWLLRDRAEWSRALSWVDTALAIVPTDREARLLQGLLVGQRGEAAQALRFSRELETIDPLSSDWVWVRGVAALGIGELPDALHWLLGSTPDPLRRAANSASRHVATPDHPHRTDYWNDLGLICERLGREADAERYYTAAAKALPVRDPSCLRRVDLPLREGDPEAPRLPVWIAFDRFLAVGSWWAYSLEAVRRYEHATGDGERTFWGDAAVSALSVCVRQGVSLPEAHAARGRVYAQMEAYGLAEADLARALASLRRSGRNDPTTLYWLGFLRVKGERYAEALNLLREVTAIDSTRAPAWSALGYARVMTGDIGGALTALDRALALDPAQTAALYNRGLLHCNAGRWAEAVLDLQQAAALAPDNREIANLLRRAVQQKQKAPRPDARP